MIKPEQIPDEVEEAAGLAVWNFPISVDPDTARQIARAAIAAALNAWPGAETRLEDWHTPPETILILPLPKDAADE
jgi:hypothetical protein